jgi:hypothetical protein
MQLDMKDKSRTVQNTDFL